MKHDIMVSGKVLKVLLRGCTPIRIQIQSLDEFDRSRNLLFDTDHQRPDNAAHATRVSPNGKKMDVGGVVPPEFEASLEIRKDWGFDLRRNS